jgi:pre-mRNA-processing factor 39
MILTFIFSFKELTASHPLSELRTSNEAAATASSTNLESGTDKQVFDGEAPHDSGNEAAKGTSDSEELAKYVLIKEEMYKKAKEYESKVIGFELAIRRPYFHAKPLDEAELDNWHNYLDFIEKEDDFNKVNLYLPFHIFNILESGCFL